MRSILEEEDVVVLAVAGVWGIVETAAECCIVGDGKTVWVHQHASLLSTGRKGLLDMETMTRNVTARCCHVTRRGVTTRQAKMPISHFDDPMITRPNASDPSLSSLVPSDLLFTPNVLLHCLLVHSRRLPWPLGPDA
jgi:hypothetical protein